MRGLRRTLRRASLIFTHEHERFILHAVDLEAPRCACAPQLHPRLLAWANHPWVHSCAIAFMLVHTSYLALWRSATSLGFSVGMQTLSAVVVLVETAMIGSLVHWPTAARLCTSFDFGWLLLNNAVYVVASWLNDMAGNSSLAALGWDHRSPLFLVDRVLAYSVYFWILLLFLMLEAVPQLALKWRRLLVVTYSIHLTRLLVWEYIAPLGTVARCWWYCTDYRQMYLGAVANALMFFIKMLARLVTEPDVLLLISHPLVVARVVRAAGAADSPVVAESGASPMVVVEAGARAAEQPASEQPASAQPASAQPGSASVTATGHGLTCLDTASPELSYWSLSSSTPGGTCFTMRFPPCAPDAPEGLASVLSVTQALPPPGRA